MKEAFERFTDILEDIYRADHDETCGAIPGCDCGCGGDYYDWDSIFEEDERTARVKELAIEHLPFDEDDLEQLARDWEYMGDLPDPQDDWYTEGDGDYADDLKYYAEEVDDYGYHVAWAVHQLQDFDWSVFDEEEV